MENITINREIAEKEVAKWLDGRKVKDKKREELSDTIEQIIGYFEEGVLRLSDGNVLVQNLDFPLENSEGTVTVKELKYVPRVTVKKVNQSMNGVKTGDLQGTLVGYTVALTGQVRAVIESLDLDDYKVSQAISMFFLV